MDRSAPFLYKPLATNPGEKIIESIGRFHREGKPIYAYNIGMDAGLDSSIVSRYFRDRGIFWDSWRREWTVCIPELAAPITSELPAGAFPLATWLRPRWLAGYVETFAKGAAR